MVLDLKIGVRLLVKVDLVYFEIVRHFFVCVAGVVKDAFAFVK